MVGRRTSSLQTGSRSKYIGGLKVFDYINYVILIIIAAACLVPIVHVAAISLSSNTAADSGRVLLLPVDFTLKSYEFVLKKPDFWVSMSVTVKRTVFTLIIGMLATILTAYPLSKEDNALKGRTAFAWFFFLTMLFSGGLIPEYMTIRQFGLLDSIWALVLPGSLNVFNMLILLSFFRQIPKELEEAAFIDGAGHWRILWQIYVPISKPALATLVLFSSVGSWNAWFDGIIYMNRPENYPLQTYLRNIVIDKDLSALSNLTELLETDMLSQRTMNAAQIFLAALPILMIYPFLQKYFVKGMVLGSVKG
jgi:putative aldouronate transport system permease protein